MLRSKTRWRLKPCDRRQAERLAAELAVHPVIARLLLIRGISDAEAARRFLRPGPELCHDPMRMKGMREAVARLRKALDAGEKMLVYGDYDADGVCSTALMIRLLRRLGANFDYYIPDRLHEGYGMNLAALDRAKADGVELIVTVDNGISALEQVAYARRLGMDVVVTDHHEPPDTLPDACAIVNPKQPGCGYPFSGLAGVGVALKLAQALIGEVPPEWFAIAAIGTVADVMPLVDENRLIVMRGLECMRHDPPPGVRALLATAGVRPADVNAGHLGFAVGPRINAGGRLDRADIAVRLLTADDVSEAEPWAAELDRLNKERQKIVDQLYEEAKSRLASGETPADEVIVIAGERWNPGVIGIVASRLLEAYYRPVVVLSVDPDTGLAKGSARSIPGFDLHEALTGCADLLDHFGGHQAAAGMTLRADLVPALRERLCNAARTTLRAEDFIPVLEADLECGLHDVDLELIRQLDALAPYGEGNPPPRFLFSGTEIESMRPIGKDNRHLKLLVRPPGKPDAGPVEAVGFDKGDWLRRVSPSSRIDIVGEIGINEWNGTRKPQIVIHDARVEAPQVFDWRDSGGLRKMREELAESDRGAADGGDGGGGSIPAVLVYAEAEAEECLRMMGEAGALAGIWLAVDGREPVPLNALARAAPWERVQRLFLCTLPNRLAPLAEALRRGASLERVYAVFASVGQESFLLPGREGFKRMYAAMRRIGRWEADDRSWEAFSRRSGLSPAAARWIAEVFRELGFVRSEGKSWVCVPDPDKRDLAASALYRERLERAEAEQLLIYSDARSLTDWILRQIRHQESASWDAREEIV